MNLLFAVDAARVALALGIMGYAALEDVRTREISPKLWALGAALGLPLSGVEAYFLIVHGFAWFCALEWGVSLAVLLVLVYAFLKGMLGGADMLAYAFLTATLPWYPLAFGLRALLPVPVLDLLYATLFVAAFIPFRILKNLRDEKFVRHAEELGVKGLSKLKLAATASAMTVSEYLEKKFWYPLEVFEEENGKLKVELRDRFDVNEEYWEHQEKLKRLMEKGLLSKDRVIFVSYGIPFLVFMFLGLLAALALGDIPLRAIYGVG